MLSISALKVVELHMCHFGDIEDIPDSCYQNFRFLKIVLNLSVAAPSAELQSVTHGQMHTHNVNIVLLRLGLARV